MIKIRFYDIINNENTHEEAMSGSEIVANIVERAGLELA